MSSSKDFFLQILRTFRSNRRQFFKYISLAFFPFIVISIIVNIHFLKVQFDSTLSIVNDVTLQAANQLSSLYKISSGIAQNITNGAVLQDDILVSEASETNYQLINRNILKLQSMAKTYLFFDQIASIRFFLPENLIISNGNMLLYDDQLADLDCFAYYEDHIGLHRWYVTDSVLQSGNKDCISLLSPIRDPLDFMKTAGSLCVDIQRSYVQDIMKSGMILDRTDCYLVDLFGNTILRSGDHTDFDVAELLSAHPNDGQSVTKQVKSDGMSCLLVIHPVVDSDMFLLYLVPTGSITQRNLMNYAFQILLMIAEIVIVMLLAAALSFIAINGKNNRLKLLNQQINPHFLYNALDMINWKAINSNLPDIYRPIQKLSRFYKLTLNHGLDFISLKEEFHQLSLYLELQDIRFGHQISYDFDLPPELSDCVILHMILQPIVENSILHGILEQADKCGQIHIAARQQNDELFISIEDSGIGMDDNAIRKVFNRKESKGYGLDSVQERIHLFYGKRYGITLHSAAGRGTCVNVLFPIRREDDR